MISISRMTNTVDKLFNSIAFDRLLIDSSVFTSPKPIRRRSVTFVTCRVVEQEQPEGFFTDEPIRENLLEKQLEQTQEENRKLFEQLQSMNLGYRRFEEENDRLKDHLKQIHDQLMNYRRNFDCLKEEILNNRSKQIFEAEQIQRLRHELVVYNQIIMAKRREEDQHISFTDLIKNKKKFY